MTHPPRPTGSPDPQPDSNAPSQAGASPNTPAPKPEPTHVSPSRPASPRRLSDFSPYVTYTLIAVTVIVFIGQYATNLLTGEDWLSQLGWKANNAIAQGEWWRLITPMFLHGSLLHITFNMYALHALGPSLEWYYGRTRFLALYLISGFAGNVLSLMFSAANSLGASTAIFGLLGAQAVFIYNNRQLLENYRRSLNQILGIAAINLFIGFLPFIDNWGHIGGLVGGSLFAWLGGPVLQVREIPGDPPAISVTDQKQTSDVIRAAIWVGLLFLFLALVTVLFRLN